MARASAFEAVVTGLISSRVKPMALKLEFIASLLDTQHYRDSAMNKPASLLVPLGNALSAIILFWRVDRWPTTPMRARYKSAFL